MEKVIVIDEKEVKFKATSGTFRRYRSQFNRDLLTDMQRLEKTFRKNKNDKSQQFSAQDLTMFENISWAMAKTADSCIPNADAWLDQFEMFSIYQIFPEILDLLVANMKTLKESKNFIATTTERK